MGLERRGTKLLRGGKGRKSMRPNTLMPRSMYGGSQLHWQDGVLTVCKQGADMAPADFDQSLEILSGACEAALVVVACYNEAGAVLSDAPAPFNASCFWQPCMGPMWHLCVFLGTGWVGLLTCLGCEASRPLLCHLVQVWRTLVLGAAVLACKVQWHNSVRGEKSPDHPVLLILRSTLEVAALQALCILERCWLFG